MQYPPMGAGREHVPHRPLVLSPAQGEGLAGAAGSISTLHPQPSQHNAVLRTGNAPQAQVPRTHQPHTARKGHKQAEEESLHCGGTGQRQEPSPLPCLDARPGDKRAWSCLEPVVRTCCAMLGV